MKQVLFVVDEKKMGGVSILLEDILSQIDLNKLSVDVLILHNSGECLNHLPSKVRVIYGTKFFEVIDIPLKDIIKEKNIMLLYKKIKLVFFLKSGYIMNKLKKERNKILSKQYDVEIAFKSGFCTIFTAVGNSKKKISWVHEDYSTNDATEKYRKLFKKVFSKIDVVVGITTTVIKSFQAKYPNCKNVIVINNLVNCEKILKMSQEPAKLKKENLTFISVGRLHGVKGYDRLIRACGRLKKEKIWKNCTLSIIGSGNEKDNLQKLIHDFQLDDTVYLLGKKSNPYSYVKQADLFLLTSRSEGFGNVMIESLILQVPVLATEVANINQTLNKEEYGFVVENSEEGIYHGLKMVIQHPELLKEKNKKVNSYHYNNKKIIKQIEQLLEK